MSPASPGAVAQGSCPVSWRPWDSAEDCSGWQGRSRAELCILSQRLPLGGSSPCEGPEALTAEGVSGGTVGGGGSTRVDSEDKALGTCDRQAVEGEQCRCPGSWAEHVEGRSCSDRMWRGHQELIGDAAGEGGAERC